MDTLLVKVVYVIYALLSVILIGGTVTTLRSYLQGKTSFKDTWYNFGTLVAISLALFAAFFIFHLMNS